MEFFKEDEERTVFTLLSNEIAYLKKTFEEHTGRMESALKQAEGVRDSLGAKTVDLEKQIKERDMLLEIRDAELKALKSKMQALQSRMTRLESILKEALAFSDGEKASEIGVVSQG